MKTRNRSTMINDLIKNYGPKNAEKPITALYQIEIQKLMLHKIVTWNDMKFFQRSTIVFNAKYASNFKNQARRVVLVVANQKASPMKSRSNHHVRHWNSQVSIEEYSTSLRYGNTAESNETPKRNDRGTLLRRRAVPHAHARTRIHAIRHGTIESIACVKRIYVASSEERAYYRDQYKVVPRCQDETATP